jgi:hypothetical protein
MACGGSVSHQRRKEPQLELIGFVALEAQPMIIEGKICCLSLGTRLHLKAEVTLPRTNIYECIIILVSLIYMHLGYLQP